VSRSRLLRGLVVATVSACALTGCGTHPGSAAVVGSETITDTRLDDVAGALCAAQASSAQQPQALASRAALQGALSVLVESALSRQYAKSRGVEADQEQVSAALAANKTTIDALPAAERPVFRETLIDYAEGQLSLIDIGRRVLRQRGTKAPTDQRALATATRLRNQWAARNADVSVDPRYGTFSAGALKASNGSLSVPVSSEAVAGAAPTPGPDWIASLPANQKCS